MVLSDFSRVMREPYVVTSYVLRVIYCDQHILIVRYGDQPIWELNME